MRRGRIFFYLALILLLGLVAVVIIWQRFIAPSAQPQNQVTQPTAVIDVVNVLVVTQHVPRGTVVTRDVLSLVPIQRQLFIQGMFTDISQVEGKLAKFDLDAGIPLTKNMLVDSAESLSASGSISALSIPRGMVAVAIPISKLTNSYPPKPGDHLNVIVTLKFVDVDTDFQSILPNQTADVIAPGVAGETGQNYLTAQVASGGVYGASTVGKTEVIAGLGQTVYSVPSELQRPRQVSQNLLQNAVVLKVGNFSSLISGPDEQNQTTTEQGNQPAQGDQTPTPAPPSPNFISLIVTPQDAITLNYLLSSGAQLTFVLRNSEDDSRVQTEAVTLQYLLNQYNIPVPVKLPYSMQPRVDEVTLPSLNTAPQPTAVP
jgi:Flp pilus assembly protein CpaB